MVRHSQTVALLFLIASPFLVRAAHAQISPGELSAPHAALEGISNCTSCHELGEAVSNDKCLTCHTELRSRISAGTGYHASLAAKACADCHKEHHGRTFPLVRFDTRSFNHASVQFALEGRHAMLECASCHTRKYLKAQDVLQNKTLRESHTLLGLAQDCKGCHGDPHGGQLSPQCHTCDTAETWKSAPRFSHAAAKFPLTGRHAEVPCARCHPRDAAGVESIRFTGLTFSACSSCHSDAHTGRFKKPCESCHSTTGWKAGAAQTFDHTSTRFALRGKHATVRCDRCHVPSSEPAGGKPVQRFSIAGFQHCVDCHTDPHRGEFAGRADRGACESCHTEKGFRPSLFSHAAARFVLTGKHEKTACGQCHRTLADRQSGRPLDFRIERFRSCADCHADGHGGQFARRADQGACEICHTTAAYLPPTYTVADHQRARFALTGSHRAVSCAACHPASAVNARSTRRFTWKEQVRCSTCHRDVHVDQFPAAKYGGCESCHSAVSWQTMGFAHESTRFRLTGKHAGLPCARCHTTSEPKMKSPLFRFAGTPSRCAECHGRTDPAQGKTGASG